ncbi:MAG: OmpA family protein [Firmicutes bacterium]|nr:OmpA family protein [Bacillota bacterium]
MADYRLTRRGKLVIGVLIIIQLTIIGYSGLFIIEYYNQADVKTPLVGEVTSEMETSTETETESQAMASTESTQNTATEASSESSSTESNSGQIYDAEELNDLKQFRIVFYFDEDESSAELDLADLKSIMDMLKAYPDEKITVSGHVNGYPNFENNDEALDLSKRRAAFVADELIYLGVDVSLISVYNQGSDNPLFKEYGNQYKNNRVEVYFSDHFIVTKSGK